MIASAGCSAIMRGRWQLVERRCGPANNAYSEHLLGELRQNKHG
jgi:hypothetical protein